jgi:hypothetical protein
MGSRHPRRRNMVALLELQEFLQLEIHINKSQNSRFDFVFKVENSINPLSLT